MKKICYVVTIPLTIRAFFIPQLQKLSEIYDVTVICSRNEELQNLLGDKIRYIPVDIPRGIALKETIKAIHELKTIFRRESFDMVQYSTPNAAFCASLASKSINVKVRNYHLMGYRYLSAKGVAKIILKMLEKISCGNSTSIECVSQSNLSLGIREGIFPLNKAIVVWNGSTGGVDLNRFTIVKRNQWSDEVRTELGYESMDFVFGFVGRITRDKGINELLEAFFELNNGSKLLLVGEVEHEETLNSELFIKAKNSDNIYFHKSVRDIERYYAAMDALILPSYREGFGNVIIEAGALGTPSIVSNIPGPIDIVCNGKTGLVCEVQNISSLVKCMREMENQSECRKLGENVEKYVRESFDSEYLCKKIVQRKKQLLQD